MAVRSLALLQLVKRTPLRRRHALRIEREGEKGSIRLYCVYTLHTFGRISHITQELSLIGAFVNKVPLLRFL